MQGCGAIGAQNTRHNTEGRTCLFYLIIKILIFMVLVDNMRQNLNNHCGKLSAEVGRLSEDL